MKKAQITVFIIIGILLIAGMLVTFFFYSIKSKSSLGIIEDQTTKLAAEFLPIKTYVDSCIKKTTEDGFIVLGLQGGLYTPPKYYYDTGLGIFVPFYIAGSDSFFPTLEQLETELGKYISANLNECLNDFKSFREIGFDIEASPASTEVRLLQKETDVVVTLPLNLKVGSVEGNADKFLERIEFDYAYVYESAKKVYDAHQADINSIPLSDLASIGLERGYYFELLYADYEDVIYGLMFPNITIRDQAYVFAFAGAYSWPDLLPESQINAPVVQKVEPQTAKVGETSFVQLSVTGEGPFTFTSLSSAFKVSNNGEVAFFPTKAGEYYALIEVKSSKGGSTLISFRVLVNDPETKPALAVLPEIPCALGESIHYTVHANVIPGIIVNYFAETSDFRIDPVSGVIDFTPTVAGSHSYRIIAMNQYGEYADSYLKMECS